MRLEQSVDKVLSSIIIIFRSLRQPLHSNPNPKWCNIFASTLTISNKITTKASLTIVSYSKAHAHTWRTHTHAHTRARKHCCCKRYEGYLCKRTTELDGLAAAWAAVCFVASVLQSQRVFVFCRAHQSSLFSEVETFVCNHQASQATHPDRNADKQPFTRQYSVSNTPVKRPPKDNNKTNKDNKKQKQKTKRTKSLRQRENKDEQQQEKCGR